MVMKAKAAVDAVSSCKNKVSCADILTMAARDVVQMPENANCYKNPVDPTLIPSYAAELQQQCPKNFDPNTVIALGPSTTGIFDNMYYKNLQNGQGLLTSDQGCDASIMIQSSGSNTAEKDHQDNLSLAGDGFDMVNKAKAAADAVPSCRNKVSCADILTMATRDVIKMAGGPSYPVELGRLDGLSSTAASVNGKLPIPNWNLDQLNDMFAFNGLTQIDMIALSGNNPAKQYELR
ncbi:peroxidase 1 [Artemisia annua]|uniref:peroxidase n=1 Tax=Artemisia annua TaxID=35608 RepID=A0A2U1NBB8_ARTAN|nr:peroxidase 1 [Artemisia annua]